MCTCTGKTKLFMTSVNLDYFCPSRAFRLWSVPLQYENNHWVGYYCVFGTVTSSQTVYQSQPRSPNSLLRQGNSGGGGNVINKWLTKWPPISDRRSPLEVMRGGGIILLLMLGKMTLPTSLQYEIRMMDVGSHYYFCAWQSISSDRTWQMGRDTVIIIFLAKVTPSPI